MRKLLLFGFLLLIFSCGQKEKNTSENFETFFVKFRSDSIFQKNRVIFPHEYVYFDSESDEYKEATDLISEEDWHFDPFLWDSSYAKRETDAFTQRVHKYSDTTKVYYEGVDNGINIQLIFICKKGKWYFSKTIDLST